MLRGVLLVVTAGLLAGCGSSAHRSGTPTRTTTPARAAAPAGRAAYIVQADALCAKVNAQARQLNARTTRLTAGLNDERAILHAVGPVLHEGLALQRTAMARFARLVPPAPDRPVVARYHRAQAAQLATFRRLVAAADRVDVARVATLTRELDAATQASHALARGYGFKRCGSGEVGSGGGDGAA